VTTLATTLLNLAYRRIATSESISPQEGPIAADQSTFISAVLAANLQIIEESGIDVRPAGHAFECLQSL
jgi:hypothetical protein